MDAQAAPRSASAPVRAAAWLCAAFLVLPVLVVVPFSFTPERYLSFPGESLSLRHYRALTQGRWLDSIVDSMLVASGATIIAVLLGASVAIAIWRIPGRLSLIVRLLVLAPMIVPAILHAVAFYQAWARLGLLDTYAGIIIVHALKGMPFVVLTVSASLAHLSLSLDQAARSLGASQTQSLVRVILPNISSGLAAGATFAFITSWDEIVVALFITGRSVHTLPKLIWESLFDNLDPAVAALATILVAVTVAAVLLQDRIHQVRLRRLKPAPIQGDVS
jgi:putative spermidine/putrescine transport system permease protein